MNSSLFVLGGLEFWPILALEGCVLDQTFLCFATGFSQLGLSLPLHQSACLGLILFLVDAAYLGSKLASQMCNLLGINAAGFRCCTPQRNSCSQWVQLKPGFLPLLKGFAHLGLVASVFDLAELGLALLVRSSARLDLSSASG